MKVPFSPLSFMNYTRAYYIGFQYNNLIYIFSMSCHNLKKINWEDLGSLSEWAEEFLRALAENNSNNKKD